MPLSIDYLAEDVAPVNKSVIALRILGARYNMGMRPRKIMKNIMALVLSDIDYSFINIKTTLCSLYMSLLAISITYIKDI